MDKKNGIAGRLGVALLSAIALQAAAADGGAWYAGAGAGVADLRDACDGSPVPCDSRDTSWKLFGGYQFSSNWAIEAGYADLGKATANGLLAGASVSASAKATAWELSGVGILPLGNDFSVYGRLGIIRWDVDLGASAAVPGIASAGVSASESGVSATYGAGLRYDFTKSIGARLEWQRYSRIGDSATTGTSDVDVIGAGLQVRF